LGIGSVAGYLIYSKMKTPTPAVNQNTVVTPAAPTQIAQYFLELEPENHKGPTTKVAGLVPIASGQSFKMHLMFPESGFVYIVGPGGDNNEPTAFLTTKPSELTGVKNNQVVGGSDFVFPSGEFLLTLDKKPGTDRFTIIFSKTRLESPSFLNVQVTGDPMPNEQLTEYKDFVARYTATAPTTETDSTNNQAPFVRVKVSADKLANPVVFEIRIQHN
jgi:hypothetical protein